MLRRSVLTLLLALAAGLSGAGAQVTSWPSENPPRPLPSRPISFPP